MPAAIRPYVTAGVALVGASVISVTPIAPSPPEIRVANPAVRLAAASVANVPANLINAVLSIPMAELQGIQRFADAMESSGSWWVYSPVNVLGWDPANPEMTKGIVDLLLPFQPLSTVLGTHLNWWLAANLPMHAGCSGLPPCPDPFGMLSSMFTVGPWEFYDADGFTFPTIFNPVSEHEGEVSQELGETGEEVDWSGQQVILDPFEPFTSVMNYLMADPGEVTFPTFEQAATVFANLAAALTTTFYPFVPMSYIWDPEFQLLAPLFRVFAPVLCPDCNPEDPSLPPVTSVDSPGSAQLVTLDTTALRVSGGDVQQGEDLSNKVASPNTQQNGLAVTETAGGDVQQYEVISPDAQQNGLPAADIATTPDPVAGDVLTTEQDETGASGGETAAASTVPLIELTKDGNKFTPGQSGQHHMPSGGGLSHAVQSVRATINKVTDRFTGGGGTSAGDTNTSEASAGNTDG